MKITIVPTSTITDMDGVPVRLWRGQTESGIPVMLAVHRVIVNETERQAEFEAELHATNPPEEDRRRPLGQVLAIPLRMLT
jgi:hypothetical protein